MSVFLFYFNKSNDIHLFKLVEYIRIKQAFNIAKNENNEYANKLTTSKLILLRSYL